MYTEILGNKRINRDYTRHFNCPECEGKLIVSEVVKVAVSCPICSGDMRVRNSWTVSTSLRRKNYRCKLSNCCGSLSFFEELLTEVSTALEPPKNTNVKYLLCTDRACSIKHIMTVEEPAPQQPVTQKKP